MNINNIQKLNKVNIFFIILCVIIYSFLTIYCFNNCYFWDTIQQVSKEAHWFYLNGFKTLIIPQKGSDFDIMATGYHPPLMGIITAILWKIFGYKLWVSHAFIYLWGLLLIYNIWKLLLHFFDEKYSGIALFIILTDVTILAQFSISSPDFIMLTAFVICIRAIIEKKRLPLAIGLFFLSCTNMRGLITSFILFLTAFYYEYSLNSKRNKIKTFINILIPYIPVVILLISYYTYYLIKNGWFFTNSDYSEHYKLPGNLLFIFKHFASFVLRLIENGRIVIWLFFFCFLFKVIKTKALKDQKEKFIILNIIMLFIPYVIFIFTTRMPFSQRYFLPQLLLLTLITLLWITKYLKVKNVKLSFILIIFFQLSGHLWIYPDKFAQTWDCKLSHIPYYELRKKCFDYIDEQQINYEDLSAGFCLSGNRVYSELKNNGKNVGKNFPDKYFIYSNISNNNDDIIDELLDSEKWEEIKKFEKWPVNIIIYKNKEK